MTIEITGRFCFFSWRTEIVFFAALFSSLCFWSWTRRKFKRKNFLPRDNINIPSGQVSCQCNFPQIDINFAQSVVHRKFVRFRKSNLLRVPSLYDQHFELSEFWIVRPFRWQISCPVGPVDAGTEISTENRYNIQLRNRYNVQLVRPLFDESTVPSSVLLLSDWLKNASWNVRTFPGTALTGRKYKKTVKNRLLIAIENGVEKEYNKVSGRFLSGLHYIE